MKNITLLILAVFLSASVWAQKSNFKRYADKSGKIEYEWTGKISGTEVLIWDDWGRKEKRTTKTVMVVFGIKQETQETNLIIEDMVYSWKADETEGTKMKNPFMTEATQNVDDWETFSKEVMKSMGYTQNGTETIKGKNCQVWEGTLGKIWTYKSYALKTNAALMGINATQIVKNFNAGSSVNASELALPKGITFKDASSQFEENENDDEDSKKAKEMMKNLLEGF